jgi:Zn-dependent protease with chaperone function
MRGARGLYLAHLGLGFLASALVGATAVVVLSGTDLSAPTAGELSRACADWLGSGGPGALLGILALGLAAAVTIRAARSALRQMRAARSYLRAMPLGADWMIGGVARRGVELAEPLAFCAGYLRPRVYLSRGVIERLSAAELRAVIAHENHHARRHDPLRRLLARALADGLFFLPILRRTSDRYARLGELAADRAAVAAFGDRRPIAAALLKLSEHDPSPEPVVGIAPERVDHLLGDPRAEGWRLPRTLAGRSAVAILALAALLFTAALAEPALDVPLLLMAGCMAGIVLAPLAVAAMAVVLSRRALRARSI